MAGFLAAVVSGIVVGSVYGIVAIGFVLVWKTSHVLNFAHGALVMLGGYLGLTVFGTFGYGLFPGLAILSVLAVVIGVGIYRASMAATIGSPLFSAIMMTVGIGMVVRSLLALWYGPAEQAFPPLFAEHVYRFGSINLSVTQLAVVGITIVLTSVFALLFKFTRLGLHLRATADNVEGATIIGIKTSVVYAVGWGAACFLAVVGGVLVTSLQGLASLGIEGVGLLAFPAVVIGGLDSIPGALVGGLAIGVLQQVVGAYIGISERDAIVFGVLLLFLIVRPSGLFGQRAVTRV